MAAVNTIAPVAQRAGRFVAGLSAVDLPPEVIEKVRRNVLHDLACALAAHSVGEIPWGIARGSGPAEATLLCDGGRVAATEAVFANAVLVHGRAQDDTHFAAKTHAGAAVVPVALALAERGGHDGAKTVAGLLAGYEVATSIGSLLSAATTPRGFRASMLYGTLGAAATAASMLELDERRAADAIAIAASFAGGLSQAWIEGSTEWRWELGMAARNGLQAARLAELGARGADLAFEGVAGFARAFAGVEDFTAMVEDLTFGAPWRIMDVIYKAHPVCNILQSPVEIALQAVQRRPAHPHEVESVTLYLNPADREYPGTLNRGPFQDVGATLMSAPYCVAMVLKNRSATLAGLLELEDQTIASLIERTEVLPGDDLPELAARLEVRLRDGSVLSEQLIPDDSTYGWDWEGVAANARRLAPEMRDGTDVERLIELVGRLDSLPDLSELIAVCAG